MKNSLLNLFKNKQIWWLLGALIVILLVGSFFNKKMFEGMSSSSIPEEDKYLAPLPKGNTWSPEVQQGFLDAVKKNGQSMTIEDLSKNIGIGTWMELASQEEAQYFIDNLKYPWDATVLNFFKSQNPGATDADLSVALASQQKTMPNRFAYLQFVAPTTVPDYKLIHKIDFQEPLFSTDAGDGVCGNTDLNIKNASTGELTPSTDYSLLNNLVQFDGAPCDICQVRGVSGTPDQRLTASTCKFKALGENPEAYNVYIGKYGNASNTESEPAATSATTSGLSSLSGSSSSGSSSSGSCDDYKACIQSCNK